jgi:hypothetical protein
MLSKPLRSIFSLGVIACFMLLQACSAASQTTTSTNQTYAEISAPAALATGVLYEQPVDPNGKLLLSAWLDPDGSDYDQYVWDSFILPAGGTITEIHWYGVYDPSRFGRGKPVVDFRVSIYPSTAANTEPAVAGQPLMDYQTGGNAGETATGTASGGILYAYAFSLPASFTVSAGVKYWVQIEAAQNGSIPDWCLAAGSSGNGSHYRRESGAGGDILYRSAPGDAAFTLVGPVADTATPTDTPTDPPIDTPTDMPTDTATTTATPTATETNTPTDMATVTPTDTPTSAPTDTATPTPPPTATPTYTPTSTPTPISSTPGKVTGGGTFDSGSMKATFGFEIRYDQRDAAPKGNLTYQDHTSGLRLKDVSFDLLVIDGNHAWFTGTGTLNDGQLVSFTVAVDDLGQGGMFSIFIPDLNGYTAGGNLSGGNIKITAR